MSNTAKAVMEVAQKYLGTKENPAGSNNVIFNTNYYNRAVSGDDYPWCCAFVWDIFRMANASDLFYDGKKTAYCPTYESWAISKGLSVGKDNGQYGDVATMDFGKGRASHIGFILAKLSDGTYQTIEGNTSVTSNDNGGAVMVRVRSKDVIRNIFRPKYITDKNYLEKGDVGNDVKKMQTMLIACGYSCGDSGADGSFGDATYKALRAFQSDEKLEVDGIYRSATKNALERKYSAMSTVKFTFDEWIAALKAVYLMAHNGGYIYSDSQTLPPCADKRISCDRLPARALWDLGMTDQRKGGEVVSTFPAWFERHGFIKITERDKLQGGDVIFVDDGTGGNTPTWKWHVFVITTYDKKTGMCHKYDTGSNERIKASQPFYTKLEEWGTSKRFRFAYRAPYAHAKGPLNGTYVIESAVNRDFALDVKSASTADKANVQLYKKNGTQAQTFILEHIKSGYYRIKNIKSGKVIDVNGGKASNRRNIWQYHWNGTDAQLWKPIKNSDGSYTFESAINSNYVLDLSGAKAVNKRNIHLYKKNGTAAQKWYLNKVS